MSPGSASSMVSVTLCLPRGERYRVELSPDDLTSRLTPGRKAPREFGMAPVVVEIEHPAGRHLVPVSPAELTRLLSRAQPISRSSSDRRCGKGQVRTPGADAV